MAQPAPTRPAARTSSERLRTGHGVVDGTVTGGGGFVGAVLTWLVALRRGKPRAVGGLLGLALLLLAWR